MVHRLYRVVATADMLPLDDSGMHPRQTTITVYHDIDDHAPTDKDRLITGIRLDNGCECTALSCLVHELSLVTHEIVRTEEFGTLLARGVVS